MVYVLFTGIFRIQFPRQVGTKRLQHREDDLGRLGIDSNTGHKVKEPVRLRVIIIIQAVQFHNPQQ